MESPTKEVVSEKNSLVDHPNIFRSSGIRNHLVTRGWMLVTALVFVSAIGSTACAQRGARELTHPDDVSINFEFVAKPGETKKYLADLKLFQNVPGLPNGYQLIDNRSYFIKSDAILYGETMVSFRVPVNNPVDFGKVKILRLTSTDINSNGLEWHDCTLSSIEEEALASGDNQMSEDRKTWLSRFLPDFKNRSVSCNAEEFGSENYLAVVLETEPPPKQPSTRIDAQLLSQEKSADGTSVKYSVSFKNNGPKSLDEITIYSLFADDLKATVFTPSQGHCQIGKIGKDPGSLVCYLGPLETGSSATISFTAVPSNMSGPVRSEFSNKGWMIWVFLKERALDPNWPINRFAFKPLSGNSPTLRSMK